MSKTIVTRLRDQSPRFVQQVEEADCISVDSDPDTLLKAYGHWKGTMQMCKVWGWVSEHNVDEVSLWCLSRDNIKKRDTEEVAFLNYAYRRLLDIIDGNDSIIHRDNIQVRFHGDQSLLEEELVEAIETVEHNTEDYDNGRLNVLFGYDGPWDTAQAAVVTAEKLKDFISECTNQGRISSDGGTGALSTASADVYNKAISTLRSELQVANVDILLAYGPERSHISHFANLQIGQSTIYFPIDWSEVTDDDLTRLQAGEIEDKVLPKKHWPEAEQADIEYALQKHKFRSKTKGG